MRSAPTRVLLIDAVPAFRLAVSSHLHKRDDVEVVGATGDLRIGERLLKTQQPDVVILDASLATASALRCHDTEDGHVKVVQLSPAGRGGSSAQHLHRPVDQTRKSIIAWVDAVLIAALMHPSHMRHPAHVHRVSHVERAPRAERPLAHTHPAAQHAAWAPPARAEQGPHHVPEPHPASALRPPPSRPEVIAIAVSTGGPQALLVVLPQLPESLPVPVVIVQHMPVKAAQLFVKQLDRICPLRVRAAKEGETLQPGSIWIASSGLHLTIHRRGAELVVGFSDGPPEHGCKPAADPMLRSLAQAVPGGVVVAILTGMGADGASGAKQIYESGGVVIAQDEETSVVWGMPGAAVRAGIVQEVLPLEEIAPALCRMARGEKRVA